VSASSASRFQIVPSAAYTPFNVRYVTEKVRARNKIGTIYLTYKGVRKPMAEHAENAGLRYNVVRRRLLRGWSVEENGLGVIFDRSIPDFATRELRPALDALIPGHAPQRYVCHPGGAKVLVALEQALDLPEGALDAERAVLARTGNMSAPTVLFVLEQVLASDQRGYLLVLALGPGFTLAAVPILVP